jgi:hypothetical protein
MISTLRMVIPALQLIATIAGRYIQARTTRTYFIHGDCPDTLHTGFTFAYSHVVMPPITAHVPPKIMAKQWLQAY